MLRFVFFFFFFNTTQKATEFVLKYFIYIVFMEILLLVGLSLLYVSLGTLDMLVILFETNSPSTEFNFLLLFSIFLIILSFFFKIGVFPFHFYILDLYRITSYFGILIFTTVPKFVYFYFINFFFKIIFSLELFSPYKESFLLKMIYVCFFLFCCFLFFFQI